MQLTEDEIIKKYGTLCKHFDRNCNFPYEYEWTCISCGYNVRKQKHEPSKIQRLKNFINRIKYAEYEIFCICVDVYKTYEGDDFDKTFEASSTWKKKQYLNRKISRYE